MLLRRVKQHQSLPFTHFIQLVETNMATHNKHSQATLRACFKSFLINSCARQTWHPLSCYHAQYGSEYYKHLTLWDRTL